MEPANETTPHPGSPPVAARLRGVRSSPVRDILALTAREGVISFAGGLPAPDLFDSSGLRDAFAQALSEVESRRTLQYSTTEGDPELRARIAARLTVRGLPSDAEDLLITTGSQQALTLAAAVLLDPGDTVLVEEPAYLAALQAFGLAGAVPIPVPCDDRGLDPDSVASLAAQHRPKLLYTVATFQNPTGRTLPLERRHALVELAHRHGFWLVEDDPYGELRYSGETLAPIASLPGASERCLALGSLSKIVAPGLRIGWVRAPQALRRPLAVAKQASDLHTSTVVQSAAAHWLGSVDLDSHIAGLCSVYRDRRDALLAGLAGALPPGSSHNRPDGGMFVWAALPKGLDAEALLPRALDEGVAYIPGAPFFAGQADPRTLRLSFTTHRPDEIADGLTRLARALRG